MENIRGFFKRVRIDNILRAILLIVMGIMFFIQPTDAMVSAAMILSIFILVDGIISLVVYFLTSGLSSLLGSSLVGSLFKILFGLICLCNLGSTTAFFSYLFAFYVIIMSINSIEEAMYLRKVNYTLWFLDLILALISLAGGITMLFLSPLDMVTVVGYVTGATLLVAAIDEILIVIQMVKVKNEVKSIVKPLDNVEEIDEKK